jgi:hypothetical protein
MLACSAVLCWPVTFSAGMLQESRAGVIAHF